MTQINQPVSVAVGADDGHPDDCPFCAESPRTLLGYKTKHGDIKDEKELERNLWTQSDMTITHDNKVGPIYPLPGGGDLTNGWVAKERVLEDFPVEMGAAPHHIIPGKAAMAPSSLEQWTRASEGKIKEDIGYSIDCANNGIFLPHLPQIYWTKEITYEVEKDGKRQTVTKTLAQYYGQTWEGLSPTSKQSITFLIMAETQLQVHFTDHSTPYEEGALLSYDTETKEACDNLSCYMELMDLVCERSKDSDGKHFPPYSLVHLINKESAYFRGRITGIPSRWESFVSPFAKAYRDALVAGTATASRKLLITRKLRDAYNRRMKGSPPRRAAKKAASTTGTR